MSRTFVNGRSRDVIMVEMRQRIERGDQQREIEETIQVCCISPESCMSNCCYEQAMCDIAKDRAKKLQLSRI